MKSDQPSEVGVDPLPQVRTAPEHRVRLWVLASFFAALTAVGAWLRIPLPSGVPLSLQTFFVLLAGGVLGPRYGALSQVLYLLVGLIGAPVFAEGGGLGYVVKPTFGYLVGFPIAAFVVGTLTHRSRHWRAGYWSFVAANSVAVGAIFILGVSYLYLNLRYILGTPLPWKTVVWTGAIVFLPGDAVKVLLAAALQVRLRPILARQIAAATTPRA